MTDLSRSALACLAFAAAVFAPAHPATPTTAKPISMATAQPSGKPAAEPTAPSTPSFTPQEVGIDEKLGQLVALDTALQDENHQTVTLRSILDRPTILSLNYFSCAAICTPQLGNMAEVFDRTEATPYRDYQVLTVSFDARDTPEIAAQKRSDYQHEIKRPFPQAAWRFLTGDAVMTRRLADSVGFKFKPQGNDFIHPAALIFLSPKGEITRYMYGITYLPADVQMAIQEASRGEARPTINKWLNICFNYDPEGRKYVFSLTRTAAMLIIFGAVVFVMILALKRRHPKEHA